MLKRVKIERVLGAATGERMTEDGNRMVAKWPLAIRWLARHKTAGETGVGDTLARLLAKVGADKAAKTWERLAGKPCGCKDRQAWLNAAYRYQ